MATPYDETQGIGTRRVSGPIGGLSIGNVGQAVARRNAGRGQTPNAPEVNDEPGFGMGNRSGVGPQTIGERLAAPLNRAVSAIGGAYSSGAQSGIPGAGFVAAEREGLKQAFSTVPGAYKDQAIAAITPAARTVGALGTLAATGALPSAANDAGLPGPQESAPGNQAIAAPSPGNDPDEQGGNQRGDSYGPSRSVTVHPATPGSTPPAVPQPTNVDERSAAVEVRAGNAAEQANANSARQRMLQQGQLAQTGQDVERARGEARVANWEATNGADMVLAPENGGYDQQRQAIARNAVEANARVNDLTGAQRTQQTAYAAPQRDPIADAAAQGQSVVGQQEGLQRIAQAPVQAALTGAQTAGVEQNTRIQQIALQQHEREQRMLEGFDTAKTPEEREQIIGQVMALRGQPIYETHVGAGGINPQTGQPFPGQAFIVNKLRGTANQVGGSQPAKPGREEATQQAKEAIAKGATKDAVNARLKDWGYPTL